jgi:hypothetical protein
VRTKLIIGFGVLVFAGIVAVVCFSPAKPGAGPWKLADGSELSLAGITHGKTNTMRYGNRVADFLYPILTPALRKRFNSKVAVGPSMLSSNTVVLWFWIKGGSLNPPPATATPMSVPVFRGQSHYAVTTVDENGMESSVSSGGAWAWNSGSNLLECWTLHEYPRRSQEIKVRIYNKPQQNWLAEKIADFVVPNPLATNYPVWDGKPAPVTVETNGLSVTLTKFETGRIAENTYSWTQSKMVTGAELTVSDPLIPLEWGVRSVTAKSATGEGRRSLFVNKLDPVFAAFDPDAKWPPAKNASRFRLQFPGTCWLQEPAWKIVVELEHLTNFPPEELWVIKGIRIPVWDGLNELNLKTNIGGREIEFVGLSSKFSTWGARRMGGALPPDHEIKVRTPFRGDGANFKVAEVLDDQGREVGHRLQGNNVYMQGSSPRNPAIESSFSLDIPTGAKSIDVTLACPKSVFVEILAKPTRAKSDEKK